MTTVVTVPESVDVPGITDRYRVFLAGAIDMGAAEDWQAKVIATLQDVPELVLMNPRRAEFTSDTLIPQIEWELDALEKADTVFMWLPSDSKAPISLFEAGLYWKSGKLMIGAGQDFYRRANLEVTALRYHVSLFDDLRVMTHSLLTKLEDRRRLFR